MSKDKLAIHGGTPVRGRPMPPRRLFGPEEKAAAMELFDECIASGNAFGYGGPRETAYEQELTEWLGGGLAKGVNSGTSAVLAAVAALELEPLSEVIVPPITDPGGVMPVVMMNCVPIPADANGFSLNMGAQEIAAAITPRTRAIMVAHILGEPADMPAIMALAERHKLPVVEDCSQAHGATVNGRMVGTFGHISAFSTMSGKHHASGAQGGFIYTPDKELFWRARRFMDRGKPFGLTEPTNVMLGLNLNSNELSAAIGRVQLAKLPGIVRRRQAVAAELGQGMQSLTAVRPGRLLSGAHSTYWFLRVSLDVARLSVDKDSFANALFAEGIPGIASYRHLPSEAVWFRQRRTYGQSGYPWTAEGYQGPRDASFPLPKCLAQTNTDFLISIHENWGRPEIVDTLEALRKVEAALLKA